MPGVEAGLTEAPAADLLRYFTRSMGRLMPGTGLFSGRVITSRGSLPLLYFLQVFT